jgi:DNA helicase-2/ATP-dependent DNA helicase PcrA
VDILNDLNPQQRQAVVAPAGPVLVLAGPGSGKTRVLTNRIAYLINQMGAQPYQILAVTFTNKAAREMEARLGKVLDRSVQGIWLGTFHAICARILRREQAYLPFTSSFVIFDDDDQNTLIKRAVKDLNLDEKLYKPASVRAAISNAKNNLILPKEYPASTYRDEVIARIYARYQELLISNNAVDFDDLLLYTWKLMQDNPTVRETYAKRLQYVLVDEFQDTNTVQYELLRHLSSFHNNLFVVGDEDQSIYRWRGADYRNVLRFEEDYRGNQKILLEQNYRSTQIILDAARAVIDHNRYRTPKRLKALPERGQGEKLSLYEAVDDHGEAAYVVETIQQHVSSMRAKAGEFAVMYRTNAQSRLLEEAFLRAGMPYRLVGAQRFYGRREVKDIICYLRVVQNPSDEISLARVVNVPPRGLGDKAQVSLQMAAQAAKISAGHVLLDLAARGKESPHWEILGRAARMLADVGALLASWREQLDTGTIPDLFDHILADTGYREYIDDATDEGAGRWENVQELRRLAYEYQERGLSAFLENLALVSDQDTIPEETEAPTLLTLHAAKGLEFPLVFITGLDDGMLPHNRALDDPEEMAEERRLFYVGITRAKKRVFLVRAAQRSTYGSFQDSVPSRFLEDIPSEMIQNASPRGYSSRRSSSSYNNNWGDSRSMRSGGASTGSSSSISHPAPSTPGRGPSTPLRQAAPILPARYRAGMRVTHPNWGEGLVIDSRVQDGDETIDVAFESVGFKRLLGSLANLQIIK